MPVTKDNQNQSACLCLEMPPLLLQALQVFESHAGHLGYEQFSEFSLPYLREIAQQVKEKLKASGIIQVPMVRLSSFMEYLWKMFIWHSVLFILIFIKGSFYP